jgi:hypothetical protein
VTPDPLAALVDLPGVFEATDAARAAIDGLLREPALRRGRGQIRAQSRRRAAWASARLAGVDLPLEQFDPPFGDDAQGRLSGAALRMAGEVRDLSDTWRRAPLQALARLHTLAAVEVADAEALGRPRDDPAVAARLAGLADVVTSTDAPGVVVAAVVHGELLELQAFGWGDDLVARAAMRLVLVSRGVDPDALTVPEEGLLELGVERYDTALAAYRTGTPEGLAHWLVHNAAAVQQGAAVTRRLCT